MIPLMNTCLIPVGGTLHKVVVSLEEQYPIEILS